MKKVIVFLLVTLLGWNIVLSIQLYRVQKDVDEKQSVIYTDSAGNITQARVEVSSDVTDIVEQSENKVVTITSAYRGQSIGSGSGAIYKVADQSVFIITNQHVVESGDSFIVTFANGQEEEANLVGSDQLTDLALLKLDVDFEAEAFVMGDSSLVKKGEYVIAMGSPLGIEYQGSVSGGLISGVDRRMEMDTDGNGAADWDVSVLQTDAAINPGNSGGPLINMAGELIGINAMKISNESVEGFGFALPINEVLPIIMQLEVNGKVIRPILGISVEEIASLSRFERAYLGIDDSEGLYIVDVSYGSPAYKAGIRSGDVLLSFDDKEISTFKEFRQQLYSRQVGDEVEVVYKHDGKQVSKTVTLE